ncbi:MAG: GtrA family protein [Eubacteriales bacterium]|jgi:putative flippase GtrA|nr:GtrA family protein [Eubacteriales bacterium]MDD3109300.1 GtrA family protein [Eubacteriales bacterium]MDD4133564.1 GtrA family protein [Eubacteriales bacterium]NLO12702.1 GtrA family protein [Clostridiales bacterium]
MVERIKALARKKPRLYEALAYLFFGGLTTLVNWLVYLALTHAFGLNAYPQGSGSYVLLANLANILAWILSVLFAYATNRRFVFDSQSKRSRMLREFWLFVSARALGYVLFDLLLFSAFLTFMADRPAKLIMNALVIIFNYLASRFVIFRTEKKETPPDEGA